MAADATGVREYKGAAKSTTNVTSINNSTLSWSIADSTNWPTGAIGKFSAVIDPNTTSEEKVLCTGLSGGVLTIDPAGRGYDGTAGIAHNAGAPIYPTITAIDIAEDNYIANFKSLTTKATPADADTIPINDVAGGNLLKNLTWANLKATLKTYLDSVATTLTNKTLTAPVIATISNTGTITLPTATGTLALLSNLPNPNYVLNGAMDLWQAGTSFSASGLGPNRWKCGFATGTISRQTFTPGVAPVAGYESQYYLNITLTANSQNYETLQQIPDARTLAGQQVTLSFWARSTVGAQTLSIAMLQNFGTGGSPSALTDTTVSGSYTPTATWTRYTFTGTFASIAGKVFGSNNDSYLWLRVAQFTSTTANTSLDIWGVKLEAGPVATNFSRSGGTLQSEMALSAATTIGTDGQLLVADTPSVAGVKWTNALTNITLTNPVIDAPVIGFATLVTSAVTTVLTIASKFMQEATGTTAGQVYQLPVVATLTTGWATLISNKSTQTISAVSSGSNAITTIPANTDWLFTFNGTAGTGAASWSNSYAGASAAPSAGSTFVGAIAYGAVNLAFSSTPTAVSALTTNIKDTNSFHSTVTNTSRMTIPSGKDGQYLLLMDMNLASTAGMSNIYLRLYKNGAQYTTGLVSGNLGVKTTGESQDGHFNVSIVVDAVATDYFEFFILSGSGAPTIDKARYSITYLGA